MDIAALSIALSQQSASLQVGVAVTKLAMDTSEQGSEFMNDMLKNMELSVNPHIGASIDLKL